MDVKENEAIDFLANAQTSSKYNLKLGKCSLKIIVLTGVFR